MASLREQNLENDTLVILTSDHGEGMAAHQWVVKPDAAQEPVTVPLLMFCPAYLRPQRWIARTWPAGSICCRRRAMTREFRVPEGLAGVSLRPVIGQARAARRDFWSPSFSRIRRMLQTGRQVRTPRYKYVAFSYGRNPEMLFDMETDPGEIRNRRTAGNGDVLREHRERLTKWIESTGDHFPIAAIRDATNVRGEV